MEGGESSQAVGIYVSLILLSVKEDVTPEFEAVEGAKLANEVGDGTHMTDLCRADLSKQDGYGYRKWSKLTVASMAATIAVNFILYLFCIRNQNY